jgi:chromosome segregation ATPase
MAEHNKGQPLMPEHELQSVKLEVGLLKNEVEVRGRQIETLLSKLDLTADKLQELTVQIIKLNTRQEDYLTHSSNMRDEFKILHTRIGDLHDKQLAANKEIEQRLDKLDQYKSKLMGMIVVVGGAVAVGVTSIMGLLNVFKD